jgi:protein-S-isoprenylcysteine O-methyltransferase Ste14
MSTSKTPKNDRAKTIPRWVAYGLFGIVWGLMPWSLSLIPPRYGWAAGHPGIWNLTGLIPLTVGIAGSLWTLGLHSAESAGRLDWEPDKNYLITRGAYTFSRNPMYLFELTLIFGWALFYGSIAVFIAFLAWWAFFQFVQVPQEERTIEAHFGEAYRRYKSRVPRWFGRIRA